MRKRLEWWAFVALLATATIVGLAYDRLPKKVVSPFLGPSSDLGYKNELWLLVVLAIAVYGVLSFVRFIPPVAKVRRAYLTEEMVEIVEEAGAEMAAWFKLETMLFFMFFAVQDVLRASGQWVTFWPWLLLLWLIGITVTVRKMGIDTHKKLEAVEERSAGEVDGGKTLE
jgi:hypothetical protein